MGVSVFANGRTIACKADDGKSAAATPDVCLSPPAPPAGPLPVPYPNTAMASDAVDGSKHVTINDKEVMLKDKSSISKSTGDEAATKSFGMGVVSHALQGKVAFVSWSMDVKVEGENVPRHMDMTLHNEQSLPSNTATWPFLSGMSQAEAGKCDEAKAKEEKACGGKTAKQCCDDDNCQAARKCMLVEYKKGRCCKGQSAHHLVEVHGFTEIGNRKMPLPQFRPNNTSIIQGKKGYHQANAPCVCAKSPNSNWASEHGQLHSVQGMRENFAIAAAKLPNSPRPPTEAWTYGQAKAAGVDAHSSTYKDSGCAACVEAQLDNYHKNDAGVTEDTPLRTTEYGYGEAQNQETLGVKMMIDLIKSKGIFGLSNAAAFFAK